MTVRPGHRVLKVQSRRSVKLSIDDLVEGDQLQLYPEIESKGYFSVQFLGRSLQLTAGAYVGLIPINSRVTIDVEPKLPVQNLARVIEIAQRRLRAVERATRPYVDQGTASASILEFLAQSLLKEIDLIQTGGLHRWYVKCEENSSHPRGRLDFGRNLRLNVMRGTKHKISFSRHELTTNTAYNQLIKAALWLAAERLSRLEIRNRQLLDQLADGLRVFEGLPLVEPTRIASFVQQELDRDRIPPSRSYYTQALKVSLSIVRGRSVQDGPHGQLELASYVINFETLFEDYLRRALQLSARNDQSRVLDGNGVGGRALFDEKQEPLAQPDIVIKSLGRQPVVIDVKYKEKVERADINQVVTYAATYRTDLAILVFQYSGFGQIGLRLIGSIDDLKVYAYAFDLNALNLKDQEEQFELCMFELAGKSKLSELPH
jgi:5-methylcytosine-specific restriction enzyme subunit McrC